MGKKSKEEPNHEISDAIKSLFSDTNPFRRKPDPQPRPQPQPLPQPLPQPHPPLAAAAADVPKKRKREKQPEDPNRNPSTPETIPKKREKLENDEGENLKTRTTKKRKRDELEKAYEKKKYGEFIEKEGEEEEEEKVVVKKVGEKRKAEDVENVVASKEEDEGFDDESKLLRTVFVGNLPLKVKKKVLMKEFERFGEIESVRIRSVPLVDSKTPRKGAIIKGKLNDAVGRVNAYIVFSNEQSASAALAHNMSKMGENHIRVDMACPPRKKLKGETALYERKRTVFVGNLPFDLKDEELYQLFCGSNPAESNVEAIRVVRDPQTSLGKGIAYVLFKTRDAANSTVKTKDLKIRDRILRVCHAKAVDTTTPSKRKDAGPKRDFPMKRKFAMAPNERSNKPKPSAASLSYQGVRASKSGVVKKSGLHPKPSGQKILATKREGGDADKQARKAKRPAVAARKAKMLKKRKLESGTPAGTHQNKKMRKH